MISVVTALAASSLMAQVTPTRPKLIPMAAQNQAIDPVPIEDYAPVAKPKKSLKLMPAGPQTASRGSRPVRRQQAAAPVARPAMKLRQPSALQASHAAAQEEIDAAAGSRVVTPPTSEPAPLSVTGCEVCGCDPCQCAATECESSACEECSCCPCECVPCCDPIWNHRSGIWGGFLYLHPGDVDMAHAIQQNGTGGAGTVPDGRVGVAAPEYEPAFVIGADWALSDCSTIWASYTRFESRTTDSLELPPGVGGTVNSLVLHPGTVNAGSTSSLVDARYDIDFEFVDLNLKKLLHWSKRHAINYHVGARYAKLDEEFGQRGVFAPPTGDLDTASLIHFEGVGPRVGIDGRARLGKGGFSLYGNSFLSFFIGKFESTYQQYNFTTDTREAFSTWNDNRMVPQLETELGLAWTSCSGCFRVSAGYQLQWWFNAVTVADHIHAVQTNNFINVGDTIAFDGLTSRVEWRF